MVWKKKKIMKFVNKENIWQTDIGGKKSKKIKTSIVLENNQPHCNVKPKEKNTDRVI